jgi:hypothetical protein
VVTTGPNADVPVSPIYAPIRGQQAATLPALMFSRGQRRMTKAARDLCRAAFGAELPGIPVPFISQGFSCLPRAGHAKPRRKSPLASFRVGTNPLNGPGRRWSCRSCQCGLRRSRRDTDRRGRRSLSIPVRYGGGLLFKSTGSIVVCNVPAIVIHGFFFSEGQLWRKREGV